MEVYSSSLEVMGAEKLHKKVVEEKKVIEEKKAVEEKKVIDEKTIVGESFKKGKNVSEKNTKIDKTDTDQISNTGGVVNLAFIHDESGDKEKIISPTHKNMEKERAPPTNSEKSGKNISKDKESSPRPDKRESPKKSSVVPEGEYQFDPEGRSAISGQKRTGWL